EPHAAALGLRRVHKSVAGRRRLEQREDGHTVASARDALAIARPLRPRTSYDIPENSAFATASAPKTSLASEESTGAPIARSRSDRTYQLGRAKPGAARACRKR